MKISKPKNTLHLVLGYPQLTLNRYMQYEVEQQCANQISLLCLGIYLVREKGVLKMTTQYHLFYSNCFQKHSQNVIPSDIKYEDIFSNDVNKQLIVKQIFYQKYNDRDNYLSSIGRSITDQKIAKSSGSGAKDGNSIQ